MRGVRRVVRTGGALVVSGLLLAFLTSGFGPVPALGRALNPGGGVWTSDADAEPVRSESLHLPGLHAAVTVRFGATGIASVQAGTDDDVFQALGYVHARFRLAQMDLQRRLGSGRLAELVGPQALSSDRTQLRLGLRRTAEAQWAATPRDSAAGRALIAYARGANAWISDARSTGRWPALFSLTGVHPAAWTPVDSLIVQGVLTENLSFTTTPLDNAVLQRALGPEHASDWLPVLSPNAQRPYDPGPYGKAEVAPIAAEAGVEPNPPPAPERHGVPGSVPHALPGTGPAGADQDVLGQIGALPGGVTHRYRDSNAWAANGDAVAHGRAMLAGDPHLQHTLPSYWFETALRSPGYAVSGFTLPGVPGVLIGHNDHISWSLTNVQSQSTFYYRERTDPRHPGAYYWHGAWRAMKRLDYEIPVRGGSPVHLAVDLTVHGPVMTQVGQTTSVYWTGAIPSADVETVLNLDRAKDFAGFKAALRAWYAPAQNFVYADDRGHIGAIAAGYYPQVRTGRPWLPLSGTGESDVIGTIPYSAVPQVYDPPDHLVVSANDRPVGSDYPYYIGTSTGFDYGYRARRIRAFLGSHRNLTTSDFAALQQDVTDDLATRIVPRLLDALGSGGLTPAEEAARARLAGWNGTMSASSPGASLWWTFWKNYLSAVFQPWWDAAKVPVHLDSGALSVSTNQPGLAENLEVWTLREPRNAAFTPPGSATRTAPEVMRSAFRETVADLSRELGPEPAAWTWGRLHSVVFPSLTQAPGLGYGPVPWSGDPQTVNAADGAMESDFGPSLRMIVDWTGDGQAEDAAIYPGGQSENTGSPWYRNLLPVWLRGGYLPLPRPADTAPSPVTWKLRAGR